VGLTTLVVFESRFQLDGPRGAGRGSVVEVEDLDAPQSR
jgi:hypothetical protein